MSTIEVQVIGSTYSGKSSVAALIAQVLNERGIKATVNHFAGEAQVDNFEERLDRLAELGTTVTINEIPQLLETMHRSVE